MTAGVATVGRASAATTREAVWSLARIEGVRALRGPAFWVAAAITAWTTWESRGLDWQGANYFSYTLEFGALAAGIFVAGALAGGRDRRADDRPELAEEAALDATARAMARLLGMLPLIVIGTVLVIGVQIGIRIEGGLWVGDEPGRTDTAVHGWAEILQPILFFFLAAAVGVAAGRTFRRRTPVIVAVLVLWFLFTGVYWALQWSPARYLVPAQMQPLELAIDGNATDPSTFPADWLLVDPDEKGGEWRRVVIDQPLAAAHDLYLVALAVLATGVALRGKRGRQLVIAGGTLVLVTVALQVMVIPDGSLEGTVPQ